ncbi:MAG TPA: hypothetical protein VKU44_09270 [Terriglobia bacterium]|nr:hypothetical protein [Terriglobia bacterium]
MSLGGARAFSLSREAATARLTYTRVLKGSTPEYLSIRIDSTGEGVYEGRNLNDPADFRPLKLSPATTRRLFDLTHALDDFRNIDLESHRKVADLGLKTLTYEQGGEKHQAQFNYSVRREAVELAELFEKIAAVEQHIVALEYESKYDHLSLPRELLQIQIDLNNKVLADPQLMVPTLDAIARNPRFLHIAQARAQNLLERLQDSN